MGLSVQQPTFAGCAQHVIIIVVEISLLGLPYFWKRRSDVPKLFAGFLADINAKRVPSIVECLRSDNGTVFAETEFVEMLNQCGTRRDHTPVYYAKHDGVVER